MGRPQQLKAGTASILEQNHRSRRPIIRPRTRAPKGLTRRDGLLNTAVHHRPELLRIAQLNCTHSPLLQLPGELREKIWKYALGEHHIDIQDLTHEEPIDAEWDVRTLYPDSLVSCGFIKPTFQLPKVCRQMYVETSPYVYTENTFAFHSMASFDKWIKNRCLGQRRLIMSLNVPRTYTRLYRSGFRRTFRQKFPNIRRLGIDNWTLFCDYDQIRRLPESKGRNAVDMWATAKASIVEEIRGREGHDVLVEWHGQSA